MTAAEIKRRLEAAGVKEFPLLFSDAMAGASVEGIKTQTRRLLSPKHVTINGHKCRREDWQRVAPLLGEARHDDSGALTLFVGDDLYSIFPRYSAGDVMWGREAWSINGPGISYRADGDWIADYAAENAFSYDLRKQSGTHPRWRPSLHMPRWASRIVETLTDVRFERLQDISEEDARAEGVLPLGADPSHYLPAVEMFWRLWNSINEHRAPWSSNPWVVVYDWGTK